MPEAVSFVASDDLLEWLHAEADLAALADEVASQGVDTDALDRHPGAWTMVDRGGERYYAVERPDGERRCHSTRSGAAETVADAYGDHE